jgi:DNA-binding transcriptional MocR family regulator
LAAGAGDSSIRALAASTRVRVITINRAFLELEREGVTSGRGTFVVENVNLSRTPEQELGPPDAGRGSCRWVDLVGSRGGLWTS